MRKTTRKDSIRVAVVDDHPMMRDGMVSAVRAQGDMEVVAQGGSAADAIRIAERHLPDVILVDINMPGGGLEALKVIVERCPAVACIVITVREDEDTVSQALRIGARGYALKGISGEKLAESIRAIHSGEIYITPTLAARLIATDTDRHRPDEGDTQLRLSMLTEREVAILQLIAKGNANKEIGLELDLSEKTIKHYVSNILQKLQVRNRVEAAMLANLGRPKPE